ncbi:hypothetical protein PAXINDRAFT_88126 [Paxillus involutus ATCC 200175]|uniref:Uncharacterized protein n=1 Tax=Paxillus involutus ATCC 200175 TaxID=664439 RepID=A0A0C9TD78_PAXIN|nr:hypothetical protein PAXINDRAFT_88126 [Paxillus involutus ATCC 200175]
MIHLRPPVASSPCVSVCPVVNSFILQSSGTVPGDSSNHVSPPSWSPPFSRVSARARALSYEFLSTVTILSPIVRKAITSIYAHGPAAHILAYKPVAKKVHSTPAPIEEQFCIVRWLPDDPLEGLTPLPTHPPVFILADALDLNPANWLWPEEVELVQWIVCEHGTAFAWIHTEQGHLDEHYFPPVKIATVPHTPWAQGNIPIPPCIHYQAIQIKKDHISLGIYEPSTASYHSCWFCIVKQDRKSLCLVVVR